MAVDTEPVLTIISCSCRKPTQKLERLWPRERSRPNCSRTPRANSYSLPKCSRFLRIKIRRKTLPPCATKDGAMNRLPRPSISPRCSHFSIVLQMPLDSRIQGSKNGVRAPHPPKAPDTTSASTRWMRGRVAVFDLAQLSLILRYNIRMFIQRAFLVASSFPPTVQVFSTGVRRCFANLTPRFP